MRLKFKYWVISVNMNKRENNKNKFIKKDGQSIIEYCIIFSVVVGVVIVAATTFIKPSLSGLYEKTSNVIDAINPTLISP